MPACKVVIRDGGNGRTEVAAVVPVAMIDNPELERPTGQVRLKLQSVVTQL